MTYKKKDPTQREKTQAVIDTINRYPELIDYYIKYKEENKEGAKNVSKLKVKEVESLFVNNVYALIQALTDNTDFYKIQPETSFDEALKRARFMQHVIEKKDGYRLFYVKGQPVKREQDLQIIFNLTWYSSSFDVNREVNNGRGPVDYTVSKGAKDKTLVEFKLASNSQLKRNLANQVKIYEEANQTSNSIKVIIYFSLSELQNVKAS